MGTGEGLEVQFFGEVETFSPKFGRIDGGFAAVCQEEQTDQQMQIHMGTMVIDYRN